MESATIPRRSHLIRTLDETVSTDLSASLQLRHLKYIHEVEFLEKSPHLTKFKTFKRIHSLVVLDQSSYSASDSSVRKTQRNKPKIMKMMKPLQKMVRDFQENEKKEDMKNNPISYLINLFPYVTKYILKPNNDFSWEFLGHCPRIKSMKIELIAPEQSSRWDYSHSSKITATNNIVNKLIPIFKKKLTQYFLQKKSVKHLTIEISPNFKEIIKTFFSWFDEIKICLSKLHTFRLENLLTDETFSTKQDKKQTISCQEYLRYATYLSLSDIVPSQFYSRIGFEDFRNLTSLIVLLSSNESVNNVNQLTNLTSLRVLDLTVSEVHSESQQVFLERFVLPPNITKLRLCLQKFYWESFSNSKQGKKILESFFTSHPRFLRFAQQFSKASNLKSFTLSIMDPNTRGCSKIMGMMAVAILKQISTLESLKYIHTIAPWREKQIYVKHSKNRPLSLGYFYQGLESSKRSLQNLEIKVPQIIISDLPNLRKKLSKLQTISIEDRLWINPFKDQENIIGAYQIFNIWEKPAKQHARPLEVDIGELSVCSEKKLRLYLNALRSIPKDWELTIKLNFSDSINLEIFAQEVKLFLEQVNPQNNLSLTLNYNFYRGRQDGEKELEEIIAAATKNSSLEFFVIKSRNSVLFKSSRGVILYQK